ncbi:MAG: hypothetical protein Q4A64_07715 [Porphyromonadaceae bacterium]|nr:hypothetical protein [Porphyromonadaceae bacterium]
MKKIVLGVLALLLLGYIVIASLGITGGQKASERCQHIDIEIVTEPGRQLFMDEGDIRSELTRMKLNLEGCLFDSIDINQVEMKLRENPIFYNAEVYTSRSTSKLKIRLEQKDPLFLVQSPDSTYYVARNRGIIPMNPRYSVYVPVITGAITKAYATGELYDLMEFIGKDDYFRHYFGHIYVDEQDGLVLTPRVGRAKIIFGRETNWERMLHKLRVFDREVIPRRGWNTFEYLKLGFGDQVIAKEYGVKIAPKQADEIYD